MGHQHSKFSTTSSEEESSSEVRKGSRLARFKNRLHFRRKTTNASSSTNKLLSSNNFTGIALFALLRAEMQFKDKWIACLSLGEQTFRTKSSQQTDKPVWNSEKKLLLEQNGPHIARVSVFETNKLSSNTLVGYCEIDLLEFLIQDSDSDIETFNLLDPSVPGKVVGNISISCSVEDPIETEKGFVRRILSIVDYNEDGMLSFSEFSDLIDAFGNQLATSKDTELAAAEKKLAECQETLHVLGRQLQAMTPQIGSKRLQTNESSVKPNYGWSNSNGSYNNSDEIDHAEAYSVSSNSDIQGVNDEFSSSHNFGSMSCLSDAECNISIDSSIESSQSCFMLTESHSHSSGSAIQGSNMHMV